MIPHTMLIDFRLISKLQVQQNVILNKTEWINENLI